jgi:hypothetical protein
MKGVKSVFGIIAVMALIGVLAGCSNLNGPDGGDPGSTGGIDGKARFSGGNNHSGILISLEETGGTVPKSVRVAAGSGSIGERAMAASTRTGNDGAYAFNNVAPGTYTVYASSRDSSEGAVTTNVTVTAGSRAAAEDLQLTPVGSLSGRIKLDNKDNGNLGFLVFIAGTSYMAITKDDGTFTISGIPAGSDYEVVIMKGNYTTVWTTGQSISGGQSASLGDKTINSSDLNGTGGTIGMMIWKGSSATAPANPQANWVYYNTADEKLYVYDGNAWKVLSQNNSVVDGTMIWKGALAAAPADPQANWVYSNTADEKFYVYSDDNWQILADNSLTLPAYGISLDKRGTLTVPAATLGYSAPEPLSITLSNIGKQNTGALTMVLSGSDAVNFTLSEPNVAGIAPGGTYTFTVAPNTGLAVGTYTAVLTVEGENENITTQTLTLYFTVTASGLVLTLTDSSGKAVSQPHTFPAQSFGYGDQSANLIYVTVTNMDDQNTGQLNIDVSNQFYISRAIYDGLSKGQSVSFPVKPAMKLEPGYYASTVTVSGNHSFNIRNSFAVSFTVNPAPFISAPFIVVTPAGTDSLKVDWSAADPAPDSYKVYWKKGNYTTPAEIRTGSSTTITTVNSRTYTITGLDGASEYSVFVEAVKTSYAKAESNVAPGTTQ